MRAAEADEYSSSASTYVHIPFCRSICPYCDFAVVAGRDDEIDRYVSAVAIEIGRDKPWRRLDSIYFGGGTPSHVGCSRLVVLLDALRDRHGVADDAEICLEANPEDFQPALATSLVESGFNRVSFGAQSLDPEVLVELGRGHAPDDVSGAVAAARMAGFESISIDLIFGTPGESDASWERTLRAVAEMVPDHVSCYALTVEPGTPLARAVAGGAVAPDPDVQARRYEIADAVLSQIGLDRYEVSNWSVPGAECRYNSTVWAQGEYLGYGMGAHGFRDGVRYRNHRGLGAYLKRIEAGWSARAGEECLGEWDREIDRVFVGLRRRVGVSHGPGTRTLLESEEGRSLLHLGILSADQDRLMVRRPLLTDAVHRSVLALSAPIVSNDGDARRS